LDQTCGLSSEVGLQFAGAVVVPAIGEQRALVNVCVDMASDVDIAVVLTAHAHRLAQALAGCRCS
ncbi:MAG TPA: hypothetical protein VHS32_17270, partial [Streptosporangiaceae bacterium]|nr:hypothetical protein [Streptosporangiaceae bacterium]